MFLVLWLWSCSVRVRSVNKRSVWKIILIIFSCVHRLCRRNFTFGCCAAHRTISHDAAETGSRSCCFCQQFQVLLLAVFSACAGVEVVFNTVAAVKHVCPPPITWALPVIVRLSWTVTQKCSSVWINNFIPETTDSNSIKVWQFIFFIH